MAFKCKAHHNGNPPLWRASLIYCRLNEYHGRPRIGAVNFFAPPLPAPLDVPHFTAGGGAVLRPRAVGEEKSAAVALVPKLHVAVQKHHFLPRLSVAHHVVKMKPVPPVPLHGLAVAVVRVQNRLSVILNRQLIDALNTRPPASVAKKVVAVNRFCGVYLNGVAAG